MQEVKIQDMKNPGLENAGHENRRNETIVYLLCIYRVLVGNAVLVVCFIGFFIYLFYWFCT